MIYRFSENPKIKEYGIADKSIGLEYQGNKFYRVRGSIFSFRWGDWVFDIRTLRIKAGAKKEEYAMDTDWSDPCRTFQRQMNQVKTLIGEGDIEDFFTEHSK